MWIMNVSVCQDQLNQFLFTITEEVLKNVIDGRRHDNSRLNIADDIALTLVRVLVLSNNHTQTPEIFADAYLQQRYEFWVV